MLVDRELQAAHCSGVYIDNPDCGLLAGRWLLQQQAKRIVVVYGPENSNVARERVTGLQAALQGKVESLQVLYADFYMHAAWQTLNLAIRRITDSDSKSGKVVVRGKILV